jgi:subtilisin
MRPVASRLVLAFLISISPIAAVPVLAGHTPTFGYIVVLRGGPASLNPAGVANEHAAHFGVTPAFVYTHALHGYAARMSAAAATAIASDPRVLFVAPDRPVTAFGDPTTSQVLPTGIDRIDADRSSTRSGDGRGSVNINVAVLDTGIDAAHPDLNVVGGTSCRNGALDVRHGTHVAGTIGALDNSIGVVGVAPGARLWSVRVLNKGGGTDADVICGIDWVTGTRTDGDPSNDIAVANMSLGGKGSDDGNCGLSNKDAMHLAICNSVAAGVTYVVAAGNSGTDIQGETPAAYDEVLTVTAVADFDGKPGAAAASTCFTADDDTRAFFSNFATLAGDIAHTIAAPGVCILSTFPGDQYGIGVGTSMAAPHVAGTVALCIAAGECTGTPAQIIHRVLADAATFNEANPSYGFLGDPLRSDVGKDYGYLIRAAAY